MTGYRPGRHLRLARGLRSRDDMMSLPRPRNQAERSEVFTARVTSALKEHEAVLAAEQARLTAGLAERATELAADRTEAKADLDADRESAAALSEAIMTVAQGSVDRARAGAEFVQKGATAIVALYTGALTLVFSVTGNPLPRRTRPPGSVSPRGRSRRPVP